MSVVHSAPAEPAPRVASYYAPAWSDALGDRLFMGDNTSAAGLELLRFRQEYGQSASFHEALRLRVEQLAGLEDPIALQDSNRQVAHE